MWKDERDGLLEKIKVHRREFANQIIQKYLKDKKIKELQSLKGNVNNDYLEIEAINFKKIKENLFDELSKIVCISDYSYNSEDSEGSQMNNQGNQ